MMMKVNVFGPVFSGGVVPQSNKRLYRTLHIYERQFLDIVVGSSGVTYTKSSPPFHSQFMKNLNFEVISIYVQ